MTFADTMQSVVGVALAAAFALVACGFALATALTRTMFLVVLFSCALAVCVSVAVFGMGGADGALALTLVSVAWTPIILLGGVLLTTRSARRTRWTKSAPAVLAAAASFGAITWASPELMVGAAPGLEVGAPIEGVAPLMLAAALACVGLLGYGERGALQQPRGRRGS
jgi:hypothetical protein